MTSRNDEEKYLDKTVASFPGLTKSFTYSDIIDLVGTGDGKLSLGMTEKEAVLKVNNTDLKIIADTMRFLLNIVEKPRMFIRSVEDKVSIDKAKCINYHAIAKLSRDSNDWYMRTLVSVKPKQIYAEVTEDTLDIYENRFAVTLFDWVYRILYAEYNSCLAKIKNAGEAVALEVISNLYTGYNPNWGFADICSGNPVRSDSNYIHELKANLDSLKKLMTKMAIIRSSELYQALRKKKRITGNVQKTNILMFDQNYNKAYKLWLYLHVNHFDDVLQLDEERISPDTLSKEYKLYCFLSLCSCLNKMGVECTYSPTYIFDKQNGLTTTGEAALFTYKGNELELTIDADYFKLYYRIKIDGHQRSPYQKKNQRIISDKDKEIVDEFWFCPRYDNLEELSPNDLLKYTSGLYGQLAEIDIAEKVSGCYALLSVNLDEWADKHIDERLCRRLINPGDNLSDEESEENRKAWSDFRTGIALVSAYPFRSESGLNMICKILYNHLMKPMLKSALDSCPMCGNRLTSDRDEHICHTCNIRISQTFCSDCVIDKASPIYWIKFKDDKILSNTEVMESCGTKPLFKIDTISKYMPICSLTSFDLEADQHGSNGTEYKFKTICPRCGIKLGK